MKPVVFILATCRSEELLPYTLLVFKTLRTGFPTAVVHVDGNALPDYAAKAVEEECKRVGASFFNGDLTIHHSWLQHIVSKETAPLAIVDTDMIFFESVEDWQFDTALGGARIPEWYDEFPGAITRSRLHTSLLFIDPVKVREQVAEYESKYADTVFTPKVNLFNPLCLPLNGRRYFHDTCSLLYHAIGGTEFTDAQLDSYFHFNFGTISDLVLPRLDGAEDMETARTAIFNKPELGRGMWRAQRDYYEKRKVGGKPIPLKNFKPDDVARAIEWNKRICCGDASAMSFNDLWFSYAHGIDDAVDQERDGTAMSVEQLIELFALAACVYNHPFYVKHREMLFPIVLQITNAYADSVKWELSPVRHRRTIANVLSAVGDEMYFAVSMLCGGWQHMRSISAEIRERDYVNQHDANGERL
jgi:hypothetical protein